MCAGRRIGGRRAQVEAEGETSYVVQVMSFFHMDYHQRGSVEIRKGVRYIASYHALHASNASLVPEWLLHVDWSGVPSRVLHCATEREGRRNQIVKVHRHRREQPVDPESAQIEVERDEDNEDERRICGGGEDDEDEGIS